MVNKGKQQKKGAYLGKFSPCTLATLIILYLASNCVVPSIENNLNTLVISRLSNFDQLYSC